MYVYHILIKRSQKFWVIYNEDNYILTFEHCADIDKRQYQKPIRVGVLGIHTKAKDIHPKLYKKDALTL